MIDDDLDNLSDDELERVQKMLNIAKIQQDIIKSQHDMQQSHNINMATIEKMRAENDKFRAETVKLAKEAKYYPWILLLASMGGGLVVAIINNLLR